MIGGVISGWRDPGLVHFFGRLGGGYQGVPGQPCGPPGAGFPRGLGWGRVWPGFRDGWSKSRKRVLFLHRYRLVRRRGGVCSWRKGPGRERRGGGGGYWRRK